MICSLLMIQIELYRRRELFLCLENGGEEWNQSILLNPERRGYPDVRRLRPSAGDRILLRHVVRNNPLFCPQTVPTQEMHGMHGADYILFPGGFHPDHEPH